MEKLYGQHRAKAIEMLRLRDGGSVLGMPTGTGLSLPLLVEAVGPPGMVCGVDTSNGMLARARSKAEGAGWSNVRFVEADAREVSINDLGGERFDAGICAFGLSVVLDWPRVFQRLFDSVKPGGRVVLLDLYCKGKQSSGIANLWYELASRADQRRRFWEPLTHRVVQYEQIDYNCFGGVSRIAMGTKP